MQIALHRRIVVAKKLMLLTWKSSTPPCFTHWLKEMVTVIQMVKSASAQRQHAEKIPVNTGTCFVTVSYLPTSTVTLSHFSILLSSLVHVTYWSYFWEDCIAKTFLKNHVCNLVSGSLFNFVYGFFQHLVFNCLCIVFYVPWTLCYIPDNLNKLEKLNSSQTWI